MKVEASKHGVFSWNELITSNLDSAKRFYGELLGWIFHETETIYGNPYIVALNNNEAVAGMMLKEGNIEDENVPSCWDPYVTVSNVDESAQQVEELGGKLILPPTSIPGIGRFCVIRDPQGVSLNLITYES